MKSHVSIESLARPALFLLAGALVISCGKASGPDGAGNGGSAGAASQVTFVGSSPTASVDTTYGLDDSTIVSCLNTNGILFVEAGPVGFADGYTVDVTVDMAATGPFTRSDTWQPGGSTFQAEFWLDDQHDYWFLYDCATGVRSSCSTNVTELTDTHLAGTVDCANLVPEEDSVDYVNGCTTPEPMATAQITFDCALSP